MKFRKKIIVDAVQFTGYNFQEMDDFINIPFRIDFKKGSSPILTLSVPCGWVSAVEGDWVVYGEKDEYNVYTNVAFTKIYEPLKDCQL